MSRPLAAEQEMDFWRFSIVEGLGEPLRASYDPALVVLSILVASFGALTALAVVNRVVHNRTARGRLGWHATGSLAMGLGVWAMHFTAMLAFTLPVPTSYDLTTTAASVIPAILGSAVALAVMSRPTIEWWRLQVGGLSLAVGIGAMHYLGMEGVRNAAVMRYVPALFVLSIIVAHLLATVALYVRFTGGSERPGRQRRLLSALVMGLAVSGMHYT
ncbi:MAG: hypothetical protein HKO53_16045, partial [Gemmatimonadetes bacterium]|nr:hypothetical protein [Gemmatimonadota bacterium]